MPERTYQISIMGKTIEHLGSQLYKRRDAAIAELVANSWDAGAAVVHIEVPDARAYDRAEAEIIITDTGEGMTADDIEKKYLRIGRNRRLEDAGQTKRTVMGRKGIGKLAGFGIASEVELITWRDNSASSVTMQLDTLKRAPGSVAEARLPGTELEAPPENVSSPSGSRVILRRLKHLSPINAARLREGLARRFSRSVRGEMTIQVNGIEIEDPSIEIEHRVPPVGLETTDVNGQPVRFFYGFSKKVLTPREQRGFVIYVRGKTAQAPPYFFDVEATATGQHGTKYLFGAVEADFLDEGEEDDDDVISTDRQEIDWNSEPARCLRDWGDALARRALRELRDLREVQSEDWVLSDPDLSSRLSALESTARRRVSGFVRTLGRSESASQTSVLELASGIISIFEYHHFHDLLEEVEQAAGDPELLVDLVKKLLQWRVIESRALLAVIEGRMRIVDVFHNHVVEDAPETASAVAKDNLHDLLSAHPWLLNPDWQTFEHEVTVSKQVRQWHQDSDMGQEDKSRVDYLALKGGGFKK